MREEPFVAVKKISSQQGVRSSFGRAVLSSLFCLEIMLFIPCRAWVDATCDIHVFCHVKIFGDIGDLAMLVTFACDTCVWRLL